jgi:hypothetical protein
MDVTALDAIVLPLEQGEDATQHAAHHQDDRAVLPDRFQEYLRHGLTRCERRLAQM